MKVAVVGATGLVGSKMLQVLAERNFPVDELIPVASERSIGKEVEFKGKKYTIVSADDAIAAKPDVAIFSAGGSTSLEVAPKFAAAGIGLLDLLPVELEYTKTMPTAEGYYFIRHLTEGTESVVFISRADDELRVHAQIHGTGQKPGDDIGASLSLYGQDVEWAGPISGSIKSSS